MAWYVKFNEQRYASAHDSREASMMLKSAVKTLANYHFWALFELTWCILWFIYIESILIRLFVEYWVFASNLKALLNFWATLRHLTTTLARCLVWFINMEIPCLWTIVSIGFEWCKVRLIAGVSSEIEQFVSILKAILVLLCNIGASQH